MTQKIISEDKVEKAVLEIFKDTLDYGIFYGPDILPDSDNPLRDSVKNALLKQNLLNSLSKINPDIPTSAIEYAIKKIANLNGIKTIHKNEEFHNYLLNGIPVQYKRSGEIKHDLVYPIDFKHPKRNEFLVINQFTIVGEKERRPDIIVFVNGIPLAVLELKNIKYQNADIHKAFNQIQTYKREIPALFEYNEICVINDGTNGKMGTMSSSEEWFSPWKSIEGEKIKSDNKASSILTLTKGAFEKSRFLDLVQNFITFKKEGRKSQNVTKIIAGYHQYFATNKAVEAVVKARGKSKKAGVVWHTQGSGKSLTMSFCAGKIMKSKEMDNPTIIVITDRNDLDEQLFNTFSSCLEILPEKPKQATSTSDLKEKLNVASGGIIFTTIQKFRVEIGKSEFEEISRRNNIIVIADEAHRTQYGTKAKYKKKSGVYQKGYGLAKYLRDAIPNATFLGFTGTPIDLKDRSTRAMFGEYIDTYDIEQAVIDGRTVNIYYENKIIDLKLKVKPEDIDWDANEVLEGEEDNRSDKLKAQWTSMEAIVGAKDRIKDVAKDIVEHFESRQELLDGKGMIVCMSRRICVELYDELIRLKPEWHDDDKMKGFLNVVMTGSATDPENWQRHIRTKDERKELATNFKESTDEFKLAIVCDMWLTGFDAPCLNVMYVDKPMQGHGLMQAIARVNRIYKGKQGGLIVDLLFMADSLEKALFTYTTGGDRIVAAHDIEEAAEALREEFETIKRMFHGFDYKKFFKVKGEKQVEVVIDAMDYIFGLKDGKKRYFDGILRLKQLFALATPSFTAEELRDEVALFEAIRDQMVKTSVSKGKSQDYLDSAIKQIVSKAVQSKGVIDVFKDAKIKKPEITILSDAFLHDLQKMEQKNVAMETLKKLLQDEVSSKLKRNRAQRNKFSDMLEKTIKMYKNKSVDSVDIILRLIEIAKELRDALKRNEELGLNGKEIAFYDALCQDKSAVRLMQDETLKKMAKELRYIIEKHAKIDWTKRDKIKARLRLEVRHLLKKYRYPPESQAGAVEFVLEQAKESAEEEVEILG